MKSAKEAIFNQKTPKLIPSWPNHFWNTIANVSIKKQYEKTSIWNLKHSWEKTQSNNGGNYTNQYNEVKEKLQPASFIYVWTIFEHQVKDKYASQKIQEFF